MTQRQEKFGVPTVFYWMIHQQEGRSKNHLYSKNIGSDDIQVER